MSKRTRKGPGKQHRKSKKKRQKTAYRRSCDKAARATKREQRLARVKANAGLPLL